MLLLVLILVLVAFGLLVVALLTGNVLCAWLSVAVSVAAAVVLVVDWLQRRSALKAGAAAATPSASTPAEAMSLADPDPVTEVLPVIPAFGESAADPVGARMAEEETRIDRPVDGQQTVVMAAVQPSGSGARPSGAAGPTTSSGGSSSPSVTDMPGEPSPVADLRSAPDSRRGDAEATVVGDAEATVVVDIRKAGIDGRKPSSPVADAPSNGAQMTAGDGSDTSRPATEKAAAPTSDMVEPQEVRSADSAVDSPADEGADSERTTSAPSQASGVASAPRSDVDDDQTVVSTVNTVKGADRLDTRVPETPLPETQVPETRAPETRFPDGDSSDSSTSAGPGSADSESTVSTSSGDVAAAAQGAPGEGRPESRPGEGSADGGGPLRTAADQPAADQPARSTFGGPVVSGHELFDPVERPEAAAANPSSPSSPPPQQVSSPPAGNVEATTVLNAAGSSAQQVDESDPPEEPLDPAAAHIVAGLQDEVLVIDEQPRYHVVTCRAVGSQSTIPLPAREAIELGFTPCGWCTPDAVLSERHRASARP